MSALEEHVETIMQQIEDQRAQNNKIFMQVWRLLFKVAPDEARELQRQLREGDLKISELNLRLTDL